MIQKKIVFGVMFLLFGLAAVCGQGIDLSVTQSDIRLEYAYDAYNQITGYKLFIRKKPAMESVMLTESGRFYALRGTEWNPINGNEARFLNGRRLYDYHSLYSILSSTPVQDSQLGAAFVLYMPQYMVYGNSVSYNGVVSLHDSSFIINIRCYSVPYADYSGRYADNFFRVFGFSSRP